MGHSGSVGKARPSICESARIVLIRNDMTEKRVWPLRWLGGLTMAGPWGTGGSGDNGDGDKPRRNPWAQPTGRPAAGGPRSSVDNASEKLREMFGVASGTGGGGPPRGPGRGLPSFDRSIWLWGALGLAALWLAFTTIHRIGPGERGVVQTFGSYASTLSPGVSFTLPAPLQTVRKINVDEIRRVSIGSTAENDQKLVLTKDQNIIDLAYTVRWAISSPERFLFQFANPDQVVQETAESAMRSVVANFTLDQAIGPGRTDIETEVAARVQEILNDYNAGIRVEGVEINQADPPAAVNDAFKAVTEAQQNATRDLNQARAYAQQVTALAQGRGGVVQQGLRTVPPGPGGDSAPDVLRDHGAGVAKGGQDDRGGAGRRPLPSGAAACRRPSASGRGSGSGSGPVSWASPIVRWSVGAIVVLILLSLTLFTVAENEQAVVLRLGKIDRTYNRFEPGRAFGGHQHGAAAAHPVL